MQKSPVTANAAKTRAADLMNAPRPDAVGRVGRRNVRTGRRRTTTSSSGTTMIASRAGTSNAK